MVRRLDVTYGAQRFRINRSMTNPRAATVVVDPAGEFATPAGVRHLRSRLVAMGLDELTTGALRESEATAFAEVGWNPIERLTVLGFDMANLRPVQERTRTRAMRRWDVQRVLALDHETFPEHWRLDRLGISDAFRATQLARGRILSASDSKIVGYSITGISAREGFIQRLAVHPDFQREGRASALLRDALDWCRANNATRVLVNTQETNEPALGLYRSFGFVSETEEMIVFHSSSRSKSVVTEPAPCHRESI